MPARTVNGTEFKIGKILCIGRNYVDHINELGNEPPSAPVVFTKPASSVIGDGDRVIIPAYSDNCHHEAELAILIGERAKSLTAAEALSSIAGYGVAIDLTLRDVQDDLKKKGLPWDIAKGFDTACPLSSFVPATEIPDPQDLDIRMTVNGELRQNGNTSLMIHSTAEIIRYLSGIFTLEPGDVILTGTPAGVSRVVAGDWLCAEIPGIGRVEVIVSQAG
jgi:2-keto-4-pentenoate hydratase/2-oxohepta-3-ene-1,7-dioic acid hydratase in catechol pathway